MHSGDRRILDHFRHCAAAKAVTLRGGAIGKDREMNGRFVQSSELESGVKAGALRRLRAPSSKMTKRQGWLKPTEGARQASSIRLSSMPLGSGSGRKRRTSRRHTKRSRK